MMDSENTNIPEEYIDTLLQEFAYDPIRLPLTEDPAQVLYNRRTLENIWDVKHEAINPYTRQPLDISNVIPQAELRQEMQRYIVNGSSPALSLKVIPDYTQVLSEGETVIFLNELILDYQRLVNAKENRDPQAAHYWKALWQKLNLLRLYCQYRPENREVFESIRGYDYFSKVVDEKFYLLCHYCFASCDDAKEVFKEMGKIVDVIGFKNDSLTPDSLFRIVNTLCCLVTECDYMKIQAMVLRIYGRMFYDLNIETLFRSRIEDFFFCTVHTTLYTLARENLRDISNEEIYNGLAILKAVWLKNQNSCIESDFDYVGVLVDSVNLCIYRMHCLHEARMKMEKNGDGEAGKNDDEAKNVELFSVALEGGLWLINSIVTVTSEEQRDNGFFFEAKKRVQQSDLVIEIVRMVELFLAGSKWLGSPHLQFGLNIVGALVKEEGFERRNDVVRVFSDFLGSEILDEYDSHVRLLLQNILQTANVSEQT